MITTLKGGAITALILLPLLYGGYQLIISKGVNKCETEELESSIKELSKNLNDALVDREKDQIKAVDKQRVYEASRKKSQLKYENLKERLENVENDENITHDERMSGTTQLLNERINSSEKLPENPLPPIFVK
jgi:phosphoenolpyruvate carboxylase